MLWTRHYGQRFFQCDKYSNQLLANLISIPSNVWIAPIRLAQFVSTNQRWKTRSTFDLLCFEFPVQCGFNRNCKNKCNFTADRLQKGSCPKHIVPTCSQRVNTLISQPLHFLAIREKIQRTNFSDQQQLFQNSQHPHQKFNLHLYWQSLYHF